MSFHGLRTLIACILVFCARVCYAFLGLRIIARVEMISDAVLDG